MHKSDGRRPLVNVACSRHLAGPVGGPEARGTRTGLTVAEALTHGDRCGRFLNQGSRSHVCMPAGPVVWIRSRALLWTATSSLLPTRHTISEYTPLALIHS